MPWQPRPVEPLAPEPLAYPELHRAGLHSWWRGLLGVVMVGGLALFVFGTVLLMLMGAVLQVGGYGFSRFSDDLQHYPEQLTPATLAFTMLSVWCFIPAVWMAQRIMHGLPFGSLNSVLFKFRWKYFAATLGFAVLAMVITVLAGAFIPQDSLAGTTSVQVNAMTETAWHFLAIVVFLVPLQAAAEEYAFRGYLMQAWGGVFGGRRFATAVSVLGSAFVFALMHGSQEWPVFFDRFSFGVCAGVVVVLTGGLEAAIALHIVNNFFAFGAAIFFGDVVESMAPSGSTWWQVPISLVQVVSFGVMAVWWARRTRVADRAGWIPGGAARPVGQRWRAVAPAPQWR